MSGEGAANIESLRRVLKRMVEDEKDLPAGKGLESRRHERHLCMVEAQVKYVKRFQRISDCPAEFTVCTKDISRSGLSFLHGHEMFAGEVVQVEMQTPAGKKAFMVKVIRCRRAGLKVFDVAGQFVTAEEAAGSGVGVQDEGAEESAGPAAEEGPQDNEQEEEAARPEAAGPQGEKKDSPEGQPAG